MPLRRHCFRKKAAGGNRFLSPSRETTRNLGTQQASRQKGLAKPCAQMREIYAERRGNISPVAESYFKIQQSGVVFHVLEISQFFGKQDRNENLRLLTVLAFSGGTKRCA